MERLLNLSSLMPGAIFYGLCASVIIFALLVVSLRNAFHCALALAAALISVAGIFVYLDAEFLAVIQILIYVGAIVTLIIFAIMLTTKMTDAAVKQTNKQRFPSFVISSLFFVILLIVFSEITWPVFAPQSGASPGRSLALVSLDAFGRELLGTYLVPFEVISAVLLSALIGALYISRRE